MRKALIWSAVVFSLVVAAAAAVSREPWILPAGPLSPVDSVKASRIEADVLRLCLYPDGSARSRLTRRPELESEAAAYIDSVLRESLAPGDTVYYHRWRYVVAGDTLYPPNVIGVHRGSHPGSGAYVICAHYDATAARTAGWEPDTDPAPGADDNASGTSGLLEAARVLGREPFDFDIIFAFFSGEEQGLLGSAAFAESLYAVGAPLHGVFNMDMIGYRNPGEALAIEGLPNRASQWMSDLLARRAEELGGEVLGIDYIPTPARSLLNSDQASFWRRGYDAMLLIETVDAGAYNPRYHTLGDAPDGYAPDGLSYDQAAGTVRLVVASLAGFRAAGPGVADFRTQPDQILFNADGRWIDPVVVEPGQEVIIAAAALSQGSTVEAATTRFEYRADGVLLPGGDRQRFGFRAAGAVVRDSLVWSPGASDVGLHIVTVTVSDPSLPESDRSDNAATDTILVQSDRMQMLAHFVYPNPVRFMASAPLTDANLRIVVGRAGSATVEMFDVSGRRIGRTREPVDVTGAYADVPLSSLVGDRELASGVYFYRVRVRGADGEASAGGRFAVLR